MAGAYGILRVKGLLRSNSGWGRSPRAFRPKIRSPVLFNNSPINPPLIAQQSAIAPPAIPVITKAVSICEGPIQAPMAAHSFTSPIPMPPIAARMPKNRPPTPRPTRLCISPCHPWIHPTTSPASRKGSTNQFGMRWLRRSVTVATARTIRVGHHATECTEVSFSGIQVTLMNRQFCIQTTAPQRVPRFTR
jgi:hypothetical protein